MPVPGFMRTVAVSLLPALVAVLALGTASPASAGATHVVEIVDFAYAPATLTIEAGDTVTWTNLDADAHTATGTSGAFDSGLLGQGDSYSFTFVEPGTYDYLCTPHPFMTGQIVVVGAAASIAPAPSTGTLPDVAMPGRRVRDGLRGWPLALGVVLLAAGALAVARVAARRG